MKSKDFSINILTDVQAINKHRLFWETNQWHPNNDLEHYLLLISLRSNIVSPFVIVISSEDKTLGMLIGRLEHTLITLSIGYKDIIKKKVLQLTFVYAGVIGSIPEGIYDDLLKMLNIEMAMRNIEVVHFNHLPYKSELTTYLINNKFLRSVKCHHALSVHRSMNISGGSEKVLGNIKAKHRSYLKKKIKDLDQGFNGKTDRLYVHKSDNIGLICSMIEPVASKTYQRKLNAGFFNNEEFKARYNLLNNKGRLRIKMLMKDNDVIAYWIGERYGNTFYSSMTGYDPQYRKHEIGTIVMLGLIDDLSNEGVEIFDFGLGDAQYKERFGSSAWEELSVNLYQKSITGFVLSSLHQITTTINGQLVRYAKKYNMLEKVKTLWRRRLV
jgi:hypothetical protein